MTISGGIEMEQWAKMIQCHMRQFSSNYPKFFDVNM